MIVPASLNIWWEARSPIHCGASTNDVAEICAPAPLKCLMEIAEPSHILFGSDFPFSRHLTPAKDVESEIAAFEVFGNWDGPTRQGIESGNALTLFPRLAKRGL